MKKKGSLVLLLVLSLLLAGCTLSQEEAPIEPSPTPKPTIIASKNDKYQITDEDLEERKELEEARKRVKEEIRKQKEERRKKMNEVKNPPKSTPVQPMKPATPSKDENKAPTLPDKTPPITTPKTPIKNDDKKPVISLPTKPNENDSDKDDNGLDDILNGKENELISHYQSNQLLLEQYMHGNALSAYTKEGINLFLGARYQASGEDVLALQLAQQNPWGKPYLLELNEAQRKVVLRTYDDQNHLYVMGVYYHDSTIYTCKEGFTKGNLTPSLPYQAGQTCGGNLAP